MFITLEGGEGAGKSTQAKRLAERLRLQGHAVCLTREPGGSPGAEEVRTLLVTGTGDRWSPDAETLLNYAARDSHLRQTIRPALRRGEIVVCDRFMDSTRAYQGFAAGCNLALIDELERRIVGRDRPGLTLIFDLDPAEGLARARQRGGTEDRFEGRGLDFHRKLRDAFLSIARGDPPRCILVDASGDVETVAAAVWDAVSSRLR